MTESEINVKVALLNGWRWEQPYNVRKKSNRLIGPKFQAVTVWRDGMIWGDSLPNVATCANAAMEIVEAMRAKGWTSELYNNADGTWYCAFTCEDAAETFIWKEGHEATLPLAIAKAFIAAHEGREG